MENNLLTAQQVAVRLGVHYSTVHWYVKNKRLAAVILAAGKRRRTVRFELAEVERFIAAGKNDGNIIRSMKAKFDSWIRRTC